MKKILSLFFLVSLIFGLATDMLAQAETSKITVSTKGMTREQIKAVQKVRLAFTRVRAYLAKSAAEIAGFGVLLGCACLVLTGLPLSDLIKSGGKEL